MAGVFISYRRSDTSPEAKSLAEAIATRFPELERFLDIDSIRPGEMFDRIIQDTLRRTSVVIVLIGKEWLTVADDLGHPRLNDPRDYLRQEIVRSLRAKKPIIPVLLPGVQMPAESSLPRDIRPLAYCNAVDFTAMDRLFTAIQMHAKKRIIDLQSFAVAGGVSIISAAIVFALGLTLAYVMLSSPLGQDPPYQPGRNVNPGIRMDEKLFLASVLLPYVGTFFLAVYMGGLVLEQRFKNITRHLLLMAAYALVLGVSAMNFAHNDSLVGYRNQFALDGMLVVSSIMILKEFWTTVAYGAVTRLAKTVLTALVAFLGVILPGFFATIYALVQFGALADARVDAPLLLVPIGLALSVPLSLVVFARR
jgi:hypothetical protein